MKVPSAGNPFSVGVGIQSTKEMGLVDAPKTQFSTQNLLTDMGKSVAQFNKWQEDVDRNQIRRLTNDIEQKAQQLRIDPNEGYESQVGLKATERESGKSLSDDYSEKFSSWFKDAIASKNYSRRVLAGAQEYFDARHMKLRDETNLWMIKQNGVVTAQEDARQIDLLMVNLNSDNPDEVRSSLEGLKAKAEESAQKASLKTPDYGATYGKGLSIVFGRAIDEERLDVAEQILNSQKDMFHAADYYKCVDYLERAKKAQEKKQQSEKIGAMWRKAQEPNAMLGRVVKRISGKDVTSNDIKAALELAGGDTKKAAGILAAGIDDYRTASKGGTEVSAEKKNFALSVSKQFDDLLAVANKRTFDSIYDEMREMFPDADEEDINRAARKECARLRREYEAEQRAKDENTTSVIQSIRTGTSFDAIPNSIKAEMSEPARKAAEIYSDRKEAGSLATDPGYYHELSDDDRLKSMTDEQFYANAWRLNEADFSMFEARRQALKAGRVDKIKDEQVNQWLKDAITRRGLDSPSGSKDKAAYGLMMKVVNDAVKYQLLTPDRRTPVTQEEVERAVTEVFSREFYAFDGGLFQTGFFCQQKRQSLTDIVNKSKRFETSDRTKKIINASFTARGITAPSDTQRAELSLRILLSPRYRIPGAQEMMATIGKEDPDGFRQVMRWFAESPAGKAGSPPDPNNFVRVYLQELGHLSSKQMKKEQEKDVIYEILVPSDPAAAFANLK